MDTRHWQPRCSLPSDLVWPVRTDPSGVRGPTRGQARSSRWRRSAYGWYVPADADSTRVEQRILEQAVRIAGDGAITGWSALRWHGAAYFDGFWPGGRLLRPVSMMRMAGGRFDRDRTVGWSRGQLAPTEVETVAGVQVATPQRALFDEMRYSSLRAAVRSMEMAAAAGLISVELMREYVSHRPAWTGVPLTRDALLLSCDDSRSGPETDLKLVWVLDAGLAYPLVNQPVFSLSGQLLGYPDLFDPELGVVGEYDGVDHKARDRHRRDIAREQRFREHGLEYFSVVCGDLRDTELVVKRIRAARQRAALIPAGLRRWTIAPPPWWSPKPTLHERLMGQGLFHGLTHR